MGGNNFEVSLFLLKVNRNGTYIEVTEIKLSFPLSFAI
jgi:hypothetical protein